MAGDWIKMRTNIRRNPKTQIMANELAVDPNFISWWTNPLGLQCRYAVTEVVTIANVARVTVCGLLELWGALNESIQSCGVFPYMTLQTIDDITEIPGFGKAMAQVGWVEELEQGLVFPNFTEHNTPEKERKTPMTNAERQAKHREKKRLEEEAKQERNESNESNGREEKRREDNNKGRFTPPTLQEVSEYCQERKNSINPQAFIDHYEANGWMRGKNKIKSWKACVRTWEQSAPKPAAALELIK